MKRYALVLSALAVAGAATTARATIVLSDNFDSYTNGNLSGQGGWTATAAAATPMQVAGAADKYVQLGTSGQDEYKAFSSSLPHTDGNSIETSFTLNASAAQATGDYFSHLSDPAGTTSNFYQRLFAKSATGGYVLGLLGTSGGTPAYGTTVLPFNQDQTVDIVWNFVPGTLNDTFVVKVNGSPYLNYTWDPTSAAEPTTALSAANLRQGSGTAAATVQVDDLVVQGTVPEPTALATLALVGLGLARRRRA